MKKILIIFAALVIVGAMLLYIKSNPARVQKQSGGTFVKSSDTMKGAKI
ncbi:MAG: hypothetical protein J6D26_02370 [Clostridia bacterium]|nr:hypothetical protein [Clostridia bacterium]